MTPESAINQLRAFAQPNKPAEMAAYHKSTRPFLGVANPDIDRCQRIWRSELDVNERVELARGLWDTDIHEARVGAAKLLTQARLRPDDGAWALIQSWVPDFDGWAIADHAASAGSRRLLADPTRIDTLESWTTSDHMWTRRAALVMTLPWTKQNHPKPEDLIIRDRVLGWAASYVPDRDWFIQKAIGWWLRDLSKHDAPRVVAFLASHGEEMKAFARKEAQKYLKSSL